MTRARPAFPERVAPEGRLPPRHAGGASGAGLPRRSGSGVPILVIPAQAGIQVWIPGSAAPLGWTRGALSLSSLGQARDDPECVEGSKGAAPE